ncbi:MAG: hypothetical protein QOJ50_4049, partial [Cryptosporangiaceae bacterium]|nr:hypothetical protein [Cryptosporangiaceae bacterium]
MPDPAPATAPADGELALADPEGDASALPAAEPAEPVEITPAAAAERRWSGPDRMAAALIALHLAVLAWASLPGSFLADDLIRSSEAAGSGLTWKYLTWDVFGHLAPGYRLVFWLQVRIVPLNHDATVALVLLLQGCVGALAWSVIRSLSGRSYRSLLPLVVYLFSALALPSLLWWASALNLIPCHLALLAATRWHLQSVRTGRLRPAVYAALAIAGGLLFWEKTALALVELPLLTFAVLPGGVRERIAGVAARWRQWLLYALPVGLFAIPYLLAGSPYQSPSLHVSLAGVAKLTGTMAWRGLLPGLVGGPLDWTRFLQSYFSVSNAPDVMSWLGLAGVAAVLVAALRQRSRPGTLVLLVAIPFLVTALLTVFARAQGDEAGGVFVLKAYQPAPLDYRYLSDLLVPVAIAIALAVSPGRARPGARTAAIAARVRPSMLAPIAAGVVMLVSLTSAIAYRDSWRQNPAGAYLANAKATLPRSSPGSAPAMYDNPVPELVMSPLWGA